MPRMPALTVNVDDATLDRLRAHRAQWGVGLAEFARRAISKALDACERTGKPLDKDGDLYELGPER